MHGTFLLSTLNHVKKLSGKRQSNEHSKTRGNDPDPDDVKLINYFHEITYRSSKSTGTAISEFYEMVGRDFVRHLLESNYESVLSSLGRDYRKFLQGFDNFQDYLKFSFPKEESPLFTLEAENKSGLRMTCISKEKELISYAKGIITEIGVSVYKKDITVAEVCEHQSRFGTKLTIQIYFENTLTLPRDIRCLHPKCFPINSRIVGRIFPFSIIISTNMVVKGLGFSLLPVIPLAVEHQITRYFQLSRPWIPLEFKNMMIYSNHVFDLFVNKNILSTIFENEIGEEMSTQSNCHLRLKGKPFFVRKWQSVIFMGVPVVPTLNNLTSLGLHISDLAIHDSSRDYMLAEAQQTMEYKLTFEQGEEKQKRLERSLVKLEEEMKRTQTILHYLVPEKSALSLKKGIIDLDSCKVIENVTILVSDIVKFTVVCSTLKPMEVVTTLNAMYSGYDRLTAKHGVFKVNKN